MVVSSFFLSIHICRKEIGRKVEEIVHRNFSVFHPNFRCQANGTNCI